MPELPEVETVRRGLATHLVGAQVAGVAVSHARAIRRQPGGAPEFEGRVVGQPIRRINRRGKFLWLTLGDTTDVLVIHLGMSGQLRVDADPTTDPHVRVDLELADGRTLRFRDQRTFGWMMADHIVVVDRIELPAVVAHVAPDPFDPSYDPAATSARMADSASAVKRLLLDQRIVSGIGNIYADEALWRARVNPNVPGDVLGAAECANVLRSATEVMASAIAAGGTSFDELYVNVNGESGWFSRSLEAYGRSAEPCARCGTEIVRERFANRSSHFCPTCQPLRPFQ